MKYLGLILILMSSAFAKKMVFLIENEQVGKQIGIASDLNVYSLHTKDKSQWHLYPDVSADGQWLTYVRGVSQDSIELIVENLNSGRSEVWGLGPSFKLHPHFTKNANMVFYSTRVDGINKIAFLNLKELRKKVTAVTVNGEFVYNVTPTYIESFENSYFPAPYQSGEKIVFQRTLSTGDREIIFADLKTGQTKFLSAGMAPSLSKDEQFVAFTHKVNNNWDVYVYDLLKKEFTRVTTDLKKDFSPSFDHEGNLYYTSDKKEEGVFSIFRQDKKDWQNSTGVEQVVYSKKGHSLYAPKMSGLENIKLKKEVDMIGEARSSFGAIEHLGKVYVVGGHQGAEHTYPPESFTARMTVYDLKTKKWTNAAPRNFAAHGFQLAAVGQYIYAFGGFAYEENNYPKWKSLDYVERYDITTNKWQVVSNMPRKRSSNIVAQVGTDIYVMGGWDSTPKEHDDIDGTFHGEIDVMSTITGTWRTLKVQLPLKRRAFSSFVKDGNIYLVGGISEGGSHFELLDRFTMYNPTTQKFTYLPKLPFPTFAPAAGVIGNNAYMFGGMLKLGQWEYDYIPHVYQFDFLAMKWFHTGRYLSESKGFSQVVKWGTSLGILGGHSYEAGKDAPVSSFEVFTDL